MLPGDSYLAPIGGTICIMVELCPMRGFLHLWWQMGGGAQNVYGQFVFDVASVTNVIYNSPIMRGRAIHEWTSFIAPTRGRRRRLTCDKLRPLSKR